jgi:Flp pilus assembly protein TadB
VSALALGLVIAAALLVVAFLAAYGGRHARKRVAREVARAERKQRTEEARRRVRLGVGSPTDTEGGTP